MAMRFFDHQAAARQRTRRLAMGFALAVVFTVAGMHVVLMVPWLGVRLLLGLPPGYPLGFMPVNLAVATALVLGGWWMERSNLARGGVQLARRLGARAAQPRTRFEEQRLVDVVSEICSAAQMQRPAVMVLPNHPGINAFASGFAPADWAITVTDGALDYLSRSELQGLVAHECSHLVEGDTRLDMHLAGMVAGLEMVWGFGSSLRPDASLSADGFFEKPVALGEFGWIVGSLIMAAGYAGGLAGRLLQSAVSREREYLADARAVQWTRSADGLGGVLRKLLEQRREAAGHAPMARHFRHAVHMLLAAEDRPVAAADGLASRLSSHPPLPERIRRIYGRPLGPLPLQRMDPRSGEPAD